MNDDIGIHEFIQTQYSINKQTKLLSILTELEKMNLQYELYAVLKQYFVDVVSHEVLPYPPVVINHIESIIKYYVIEEIIEKTHHVLIARDEHIPIELVSGFLLLINSLRVHTINTTDDTLAALHDDTYTPDLKVGMAIHQVEPSFYPIDAEFCIVGQSDDFIPYLISELEATVEIHDTKDKDEVAIISKLSEIDPKLLTTYLLRMIIKQDGPMPTSERLLAYIKTTVAEHKLTDEQEYAEYQVFSILTGDTEEE